MSGLDEKGLTARITDYLAGGGLFNPEMANHEAVRDLLIDCRDALAATTPADVGEEPVAWRWKQIGRTDVDAWSYRPSKPQAPPADYVVEPLYSATALERVVRERDEALKGRDDWKDMFEQAKQKHGYCIVRGNELTDKLSAAEAKLAEALADRAAQAERMARLEEALRDIRDGRGKCKTCGTPATGGGAGFTDCDCVRPSWTPQDPADIAARALSQEGSEPS